MPSTKRSGLRSNPYRPTVDQPLFPSGTDRGKRAGISPRHPVHRSNPSRTSVPELVTKPLTSETWPAFARLVEKHNGIFGGCWCIAYHLQAGEKRHGAAAYRTMKEELVREGEAH